MSAFDDISLVAGEFSGKVRLFPLPNLVLFPHVMQPLHIFEPRYRDLLEDALAGDRLIAMALLTPGWEKDYEGRPALYPMACLGRITTHYRLADGTYNVLLLGLQRVRLVRELKPARSFPRGRGRVVRGSVSRPARWPGRRLCSRGSATRLLRVLPMLPEAQEQLDQLLGSDVPLGVLTDVIGYMLDIDLARKQSLLAEMDVCRRAELLLAHLSEAAAESAAGRAAVCFPPEFSTN